MQRLLFRRLFLTGFWPVILLVALARGAGPDAPLTEREVRQGYRDNRVIAKPRAGLNSFVAGEGGALRLRRRYHRFDGLRVLESDGSERIPALVARLRASGLYEYVEPDYLRGIALAPNDPRYTDGSQWSLRNDGRAGGVAGADIGAEAGWALQTDASNVIVAIIDSGVRLTHEDLAGNLWTNPREIPGNGIDDDNDGYVDDVHGIDATRTANGDPSDVIGHGTMVAGIIGAVGNNGRGMAGVAWRVQLMPLRFLGSDGTGSTSDAIECIDYAIAHGANIINASYGAINSQVFSNAERDAIRRARDAGIIFVAATGNSGLDLSTSVQPPASLMIDNIVGVAASGRRDEPAVYSNFGCGMAEIFAPGDAIYSAGYTGNTVYTSADGTSFAAPHISGALALLKARHPTEPYRSLINRLLRGSRNKTAVAGSLQSKAQTSGRLDLPAVLTETNFRPLNDDFADAIVLAGANVRARGGNTFATVESGEPAFSGFTGGASLWWRWTAPTSGVVSIDTGESVTLSGSLLSTRFGIFTGSSLNQLVPVALAGSGSNNRGTFNAVAGTTYTIMVDSAGAANGLIAFTLGTAPDNDAFALAETLTGRSFTVTATNLNSSREPNEPNDLTAGGSHSVWYNWTAPFSGRVQCTAYSDEFDPTLAVYTGASLAELSLVGANNDVRAADDILSSLVTFDAVAGTTYRFLVDGVSGAAGNFTLTLVDSRWQFATGDAVTSSPAIAPDGTVYVGGTDHIFYALTADGAEKWRYATGGLIDMASPVIADDGTVYIGSNDRYLTALNPDGTVKWRYLSGGSVTNSPAVATSGNLYFKDSAGSLIALSPAGSLLWQRDVGDTYASPVIGQDGTIYVGAAELGFQAFASDGTLKWRFTADGDIYTTAAIDTDGNLYFGTLKGTLYSVTSGGVERWHRELDTGFSSSPALGPIIEVGTAVYIAGYNKKLYSIDSHSGNTRWTYDLGDEVRASSPIVASDGSVLIGCYNGLLYHIDYGGTLRRTYATARRIRSSPAIDGKRLFVGSNDGRLYAIDLGQGASIAAPWPMFMHNVRRLGRVVVAPAGVPVITSMSVNFPTAPGGTVTIGLVSIEAVPAHQWNLNGVPIPGATGQGYSIPDFQPSDAGLYTVTLIKASGQVVSSPFLVAPTLTGTRTAGSVDLVRSDIVHPNGNVYDQFLLTGPAATIATAGGKIARISYVDLNGDIVQVEFSGSGSLTVVLDNPDGPRPAAKYNQPDVSYMIGHARIYLVGADASTNFNVFSVGKLTAFDPTGTWDVTKPVTTANDPARNGNPIFKAGENYDGIADLASIAVGSTWNAADRTFGALRAGNASFYTTAGLTGIIADGNFSGPVLVHDISAYDNAVPVLVTGSLADGTIFVNGGSLAQANGRALQVSGLTKLVMRAGTDSHNRLLPAQVNQARIERAGIDVTASTVVNPTPSNP